MLKITLQIEGMMCNMCESHTNEAIRRAWNVKKVTSSHKDNETVIISENDIADDELTSVIEKIGYKLISIRREPYKKKGIFSKLK